MGGREFAQGLLQRPDRHRPGQVGAFGIVLAAILDMDMGVVEARQDLPALRIDHFGPGGRERAYLGLIAGSQHLAPGDREGARARTARIKVRISAFRTISSALRMACLLSGDAASFGANPLMRK